MTGHVGDWDDERLDLAFRARFDAVPPAGLAGRIRAAMADERAPSRLGRWRWPRPGYQAAAGLAIVAVVAVILLNAALPGPVPRLGDGPSQGSGPSEGVPPSGIATADLAGPPFPATVVPTGSDVTLPVLSVAAAIEVGDRTSSPETIAVGGWFVRFVVPCPYVGPSPLEGCDLDFTWLLGAPEALTTTTPDGGVSIGPPSGPGIHPVTDWHPTDSAVPVAAVFVGHFHDAASASCPAGNRRAVCEARFVVTQVIGETTVDWPGPPFPATVAGQDVRSLWAAMAFRDGGSSSEIAVAGWYQEPPVIFCTLMLGPFVRPLEGDCAIDLRWLMAAPETLIQACVPDLRVLCHFERTPSGPAMHVVFETGVSVPAILTGPRGGSVAPTPVVFIGHFNDPRSSRCRNPGACAQRFVVDAIAWADGTYFALASPR